MSVDTRIQMAVDRIHAGRKELDRAQEHPDPVEQRRAMVRAAAHFRRAADELDDGQRLEE
jgi:hypothetical protein